MLKCSRRRKRKLPTLFRFNSFIDADAAVIWRSQQKVNVLGILGITKIPFPRNRRKHPFCNWPPMLLTSVCFEFCKEPTASSFRKNFFPKQF
jgi:hypothetical protein